MWGYPVGESGARSQGELQKSQEKFSSLFDTDFQNQYSIPNSLHVFEQHLLTSAIIKLCCTAVSVASNTLRHFQSSAIFQNIRDPGCADKRVGVNGRTSCPRCRRLSDDSLKCILCPLVDIIV